MSVSRAIAGDLLAWQGLRPEETVATLADELAPLAHVSGPEERIRTTRRFGVVLFERDAAPPRIEAWFPFGSDHAALVEYDDPVAGDVDAILSAFGEPEHQEAFKRHADGALVEEHVYATRGVTLSVATPFDVAGEGEPPPGSRSIVHVQLYPATTAGTWMTDIGAGPELRAYPPG